MGNSLKIAAVLSFSVLVSCGVDPNQGERILRSQGLTDVQIGSYAVWGCGKDDSFGSNFSAKNASGEAVTGVICGGFLKGYTVRYD